MISDIPERKLLSKIPGIAESMAALCEAEDFSMPFLPQDLNISYFRIVNEVYLI
ncbi:MAG TPA: hypothetical protein VI564_02370 [Candidatus Nanoarchaeia archaeon]|nr:hypothetical protein [Candidatus Nanoarchaeia archaeon]